MRATTAPPPPAPRYTCGDCHLTAPAPIVLPAANPKDGTHGRCANRQACAKRQLRIANANKHKEQPNA